MNQGFWAKLKKPILALAPMADVTDAAFRRLIVKYGKPDVLYTEFVSADGLMSSGRQKLLPELKFDKSERPIVAQLFTANPEKMEKAAALIQKLGFDGLDINMGCPDKKVEKQGAGAALIKNPKLARELIRAAKRGAPKIPISVKTRIGYNKNNLEIWLPELLAEEPASITIHARTRKELSKVPARWEHIKEAVHIRNKLKSKSKTLIIGNGDAVGIDDARRKCEESGADGVMIGRAIFDKPFLFSKKKCPEGIEGRELRLRVMLEHTKLFEKLCKHKSFNVMKKHFKAYVHGFAGAGELRAKLMQANNAKEVSQIITNINVNNI